MSVLPNCGTRSYILYYVLISIAYLQISQFLSSAAIPKSVCTAPACRQLAEYYKKIMNPNGVACDDFHDFVCHNWGAHNPRPNYKRLWAVHNQLDLTTLLNIKKLLEEKRKDDRKDEIMAKFLYAACMKLPDTERKSLKDLQHAMGIVGNWPMFPPETKNVPQHPWQYVHTEYIKMSGDSPLFSYFLGAQIGNTSFQVVPVIDELNSPYGILKREANWDDKSELKNYKDFLLTLLQAVGPYKSKKMSEIEKALDEVVSFREKLRHTITANKWNNYETMPIKEYQKRYDIIARNQPTAQITWLSVVRALYANSKDAQDKLITDQSLIRVQPEYLTTLGTILATTKNSVIANHIHLHYAERNVQLTPDLDSYLEKSVSDHYHGTGSIVPKPEKWKECIANKEIQLILGRMYLKTYFSYSDQLAVSHMILSANWVLQQQISESKWVAPELENAWVKYYEKLDTQIGYPVRYFQNYVVTTATSEDINPIETDVHYSVKFNRIGVSAAYLQWPIYHADLPLAIKRGALLPAIGHELYHGFNFTDFRTNLQFLKNDQKQEVLQEFEKRVKCYTDQYSDYRVKEIKKLISETHTHFPSTVNEDIPDSMGLKLAYREYKDRFLQFNQNCTVLPGFENYSCDQLFFIAYASSLCVNTNPNWKKHVLRTGDQNALSIRVNGAVANMPEFADAFHCKDSQKLVLKNRCDLWK